MNKDIQTATKQPELSDKKIAYHLLQEEGLTNGQITEALEITPQRGSQIKKELSKFYIQDKKFLRKGTKIIKKIADDFLSDKGNIKDSTALRLVEMQQDRINPAIKQSLNVNQSMTFIKIDTTNYE